MNLPLSRTAGALGALFVLAATALAAIGSHSLLLDAADTRRFALGVAFLFGHGLGLIAVAALARTGAGALLALAALLFAAGTPLFAGSLLGAVLVGWPTALAPLGGIALMAGWLALSLWFLAARR